MINWKPIKTHLKQHALKLILFIILSYTFCMTYVVVHEQVHQAIFRSYGVPSEVTINYFTMSGSTEAINHIELCDSNCELAHSINEIVGYNLATLIFVITILFYVGVEWK